MSRYLLKPVSAVSMYCTVCQTGVTLLKDIQKFRHCPFPKPNNPYSYQDSKLDDLPPRGPHRQVPEAQHRSSSSAAQRTLQKSH